MQFDIDFVQTNQTLKAFTKHFYTDEPANQPTPSSVILHVQYQLPLSVSVTFCIHT